MNMTKNLLKYVLIGLLVALPAFASIVSPTTLKTYFTTGNRPTQGNFINLIDSTTATSTATTTREAVFCAYSSAGAWTNMPSAETELYGNTGTRQPIDLTNAVQFRLMMNQSVAGAANASLSLFYSTDDVTYQAMASTTEGNLNIGVGTGIKKGVWFTVPEAARGDVYISVFGKDGDGAADPSGRIIKAEFREVTRTIPGN